MQVVSSIAIEVCGCERGTELIACFRRTSGEVTDIAAEDCRLIPELDSYIRPREISDKNKTRINLSGRVSVRGADCQVITAVAVKVSCRKSRTKVVRGPGNKVCLTRECKDEEIGFVKEKIAARR